MRRVKAAAEGVLLATEGKKKKKRKAGVGAEVLPLGDGLPPPARQSKGLSFLPSLTRSSREHLKSGKAGKTAGFMVTLGSAAETGVGRWDWVKVGLG